MLQPLDGCSNTLVMHNPRPPPPPAGVYGWRKRCLYSAVLMLLVVILVNVALTVWILRVMNFSVHGMGKLRLKPNLVSVESDVQFLKTLSASRMETFPNDDLNFYTNGTFSVSSRLKDGSTTAKLLISGQRVQITAKEFTVRSPSGDILYSSTGADINLGEGKLVLTGPDGVTVKGGVETPVIKSKKNMRLDSTAGSMSLSANDILRMTSSNGPITVQASSHLAIKSAHSIRLDSKNISLTGLPLSIPPTTPNDTHRLTYQVCICGNNGRLFVSPAHGTCSSNTQLCS